MDSPVPTIIVFAKAPIPGHVKTRLGLPPNRAARLHEAFASAALTLASELGGSVELHTDIATEAWPAFAGPRRLQSTGDLGHRMLAALAAGPAMIMGSDAPTLPIGHLLGLLGASADVALGPTEDGGFYAIFARRTHPAMFEGVEWSSGQELRQTAAACRAHGLTVELGEPWFDVDTPADLLRLPREFLRLGALEAHPE